MIKRLFDLTVSALGLLVFSPFLMIALLLVWIQDWHSPLYIARRVGRDGAPFQMVKIRSMIMRGELQGANSTSNDDRRITPVGHFIRRYKLDELAQLWNVLIGDMSLVGPRPQVQAGVDVYTELEHLLLSVRPGITDFASVVFADEGSILEGKIDPDLAYDQLIRPGKSRLSLFYIQNSSFKVDVLLIWLTFLAIVSRGYALQGIQRILKKLNADAELIEIAGRECPLIPRPLLGTTKVPDNLT